MDDEDFEGTLVLENLAASGLVDDFFDAIDSDDIERAIHLMKKAQVSVDVMKIVVNKIRESN